jgi:DNA-binding MarR family transcriptional regulator
MKLAVVPEMNRSEQVEYVATQLLPRAALLTRLLVRRMGNQVSRTEVGVLNALTQGPRRITELAELEGLAQPTMTLVVKRLVQKRQVRRERDADDGRVVLVSLTPTGMAAFEELRGRIADALHMYLEDVSDEQIEALAGATETLQELALILQDRSW